MLYDLINKPWRAPTLLRARRIARLRRELAERELIEWAAQLAAQERAERLRRSFVLPTEVHVSLHTGEPTNENVVASSTLQLVGGKGTASFDTSEIETFTYAGIWDAEGRYLGEIDLSSPPWQRRAEGWDDEQ